MKRFTHGIMVINPNDLSDEDNYEVIHFAGYWEEPTDDDANALREELRNDPQFNFRDIVDKLRFLPATKDCIKYFNDMIEEDKLKNEN